MLIIFIKKKLVVPLVFNIDLIFQLLYLRNLRTNDNRIALQVFFL